MPPKDSLSPIEQKQGFAKAFDTFQYNLKQKNYIGAYIIAFSILEDRISSMFAARYLSVESKYPKRFTSLSQKLECLCKHGDIETSDRQSWEKQAHDRNRKVHAAMWNLDEFQEADALAVLECAREADKRRAAQKRKLLRLNKKG